MKVELEALATEIAAMRLAAEEIHDPAYAHFAVQIIHHCQWALDSIAERPGSIDEQLRWWLDWKSGCDANRPA